MSGLVRRTLFAIFALTLFMPSGCGTKGPAPVGSREDYGPAPQGYYRILPGDTLSTVAARQHLAMDNLARWNGLEPPYGIRAGKLLRLEPPDQERKVKRTEPAIVIVEESPPTKSVQSKSSMQNTAKAKAIPTKSKSVAKASVTKRDAKAATKASSAKGRTKTTAKAASAKGGAKAAASGLNWRWPLQGRVAQTFNRGDRTRQGIRIVGRAGAKVSAVEAGTVVYSGSGLKGYGNLIIIKHNNKYLSAYGFNRRLLTTEGARVKRGQSVAEVGQPAGGDYLLHFEIRRDGTAVNPLDYLPALP